MTLTMYDDVRVDLIPADAPAVAGYVNGRWPTYPSIVALFPHARHLSIAVTAHADADCLDVEPGDATNADAPAWVKRQHARGVKRPCVYTSVSNAAALLAVLGRAGIPRAAVRLWTAHYTNHPHLCGPACGFALTTIADATQWTHLSHGRELDESQCRDDFFAAPASAPASTEARKQRLWRRRLARSRRQAAALARRIAQLTRLTRRRRRL